MSCLHLGEKARLGGPSKLHERLLQRGQRAFHQAALLLEVRQQRVPQRLLAQHLHTSPIPVVALAKVAAAGHALYIK